MTPNDFIRIVAAMSPTSDAEDSIATVNRLIEEARQVQAAMDDDEPLDPGQCRPCPGHEFVCTGTAYGGNDESYHGEGRCYCIHCGADGDA